MLIFIKKVKTKMSEQLQTRIEHSRSLEDADKFRAIQTLTELGMLVPLSEVETFHGRVGSSEAAAEWAVDPGFANGSNDSGNENINNRPSLYTGEKAVAEDFAQQRGREIVRTKFNKVFRDRVENYTEEERRTWLDRENKEHQEWYDRIDPSHKNSYAYLLSEDGKLKPKTFDDLQVWREARRLERETPEEERDAIWESVSEGLRAEVHNIVAADSDATVLDFEFDPSKLDEEDTKRYNAALDVLFRQTPMSEGSPVGFNDRNAVAPFASAVNKLKKRFVSDSEVAEVAAEAGIHEQVALQLASALNTGRIARIKPSYLAGALLKHKEDIFVDSIEMNGAKQDLPINLEYVQRYLRNAHIVGVKQGVSSSTLNREITSISFLDLEKVSTEGGLEAERAATWQKLGGMAMALSEGSVGKPIRELQPLMHLLTDVYAKPDKLVEAAKKVEGYEAIFDADAGNWEGFTLAEHTETVLRNFDETYANKLPVELLAPMRLAILAHDVGKPIAAAEGVKHRQKDYNVTQADDFLTKLGIDKKLKGLLVAVISDGEELAFQIDILKRGETAEAAMKKLAVKTLQDFSGTDEIADGQIESFTEMCRMLQVCDGGAYTSMAVTRTKTSGRYRNAPSFNGSFAQPLGFGKRTIRLRGKDEQHATNNLTPQGKEDAPRVRISQHGAGHRPPSL